ncbi:hypothetical protein NL108_015097, partial [Boleophthalmus pectinirostris]
QSAENREDLHKHRITHVLNAAYSKRKGQPEIYRALQIEFMGIDARDSYDFDMSAHFQSAADFIHRALGKG